MFLNIRKIFNHLFFKLLHFFSQNKGELDRVQTRSSIFKIIIYLKTMRKPLKGLSSIQILRQQAAGKRNQVIAQKELEKMHFEKQDKPTRKRMKVTLKKSQKWLVISLL